jgi:hypothetical protein
MENLAKNTFCVGPVGPTDKENQVKMYKTYCFRYITLFEMVRVGSESYQIEKQDPDPYQSKKPDPDLKGLGPQH